VIPGAAVTAFEQATALRQVTTTNAEGNFVFPQLPAGTYTITAEAKAVQEEREQRRHFWSWHQGQPGRHVLEVGSITDTITVEANGGTIQIQADSGERSAHRDQRDLRISRSNGQTSST